MPITISRAAPGVIDVLIAGTSEELGDELRDLLALKEAFLPTPPDDQGKPVPPLAVPAGVSIRVSESAVVIKKGPAALHLRSEIGSEEHGGPG